MGDTVNKCKKVTFHGAECDVYMSHYADSFNNAIVLQENGEPFCIVSVNPWGINLDSSEVAIKNYSGQEGIEAALNEAGIIGDYLYSIPSGFVQLPVFELLLENPHAGEGSPIRVSE